MEAPEKVYYLEMHSPGEILPAKQPAREFDVRRAAIPCPSLNYFFYTHVGKPWKWTDRLRWGTEKWRAYVESPDVQTWIGYLEGTPCGYIEYRGITSGEVEIGSFGLLPQFVGQGLGGPLLTRGLEIAWQLPVKRVWLHTCSFDHPHALANYQARGLKLYKIETQTKDFPDTPAPVDL